MGFGIYAIDQVLTVPSSFSQVAANPALNLGTLTTLLNSTNIQGPDGSNVSFTNYLDGPAVRGFTFFAPNNAALQAAPEYAPALRNDPVKLARQLVTACRASGGRRAELREVIKEGNHIHAFGDKPLPELQLLCDVDTRWSSTFLMINRVLTLHPVWRLA